MINEQKEIWISTHNKANSRRTIIAVSNCGRIMRKNGKIEIASLVQSVFVGEKRSRMYLYRFLANNFIAKTEEDILKQRDCIDHITHTPTNMYINDVRNLRWCTQKENCNFEEAKLNRSKINKGKKFTAEHRAKMAAAKKGNTNGKGNANSKGRHWYTNGVVNKFAYKCPLGFTCGKSQKKKSS